MWAQNSARRHSKVAASKVTLATLPFTRMVALAQNPIAWFPQKHIFLPGEEQWFTPEA